jgi:hypothetical protein
MDRVKITEEICRSSRKEDRNKPYESKEKKKTMKARRMSGYLFITVDFAKTRAATRASFLPPPHTALALSHLAVPVLAYFFRAYSGLRPSPRALV